MSLVFLLSGRVPARGEVIPQWVSVFGVVVPGLVVLLLWKESR